MQDVGLTSCSVRQQTYVAPLCARWNGRSYWQQGLCQECGFKVMHIEMQLHTWYQGRKHTICIISGLRLFLGRPWYRGWPELPSWPH